MEETKNQCGGIKKDGKRCTRVQSEKYCYQHLLSDYVEKWEKLGFPEPKNKNTKSKIKKRIREGALKTDKEGWVYIYKLSTDDNKPYFKIGRTERSVKERLVEWGDNCVLIKKFKVKHNKTAESMLHWYFDKYRIYRTKIVELEDVYFSVWKIDEKSLTKKDKILKKKYGKKYKKKNVEWFFLTDIDKSIKKIIKICKACDKMNKRK